MGFGRPWRLATFIAQAFSHDHFLHPGCFKSRTRIIHAK